MGPDEEKRLRQLLFKKRQLPEPDWNLFARATKRFSRAKEITSTPTVAPVSKPSKASEPKETDFERESRLADLEEKKAETYNKKMEDKVIKLIKKKFGPQSEKTQTEIQEMRDRGWDKYRGLSTPTIAPVSKPSKPKETDFEREGRLADLEEKKAETYNKKMEDKVIKAIKKKFGPRSKKTQTEIQEMRDRGWDKYRGLVE